MPRVICDTSSLISLMDTCTSGVLRFLREKADARFLVPPGVYEEMVSRPLGIKRYGYSAVRLRKLVEDEIVELLPGKDLAQRTQEFVGLANNSFFVDGRPLRILHEGEAECLAALKGSRHPILAVDEKTTRLLLEDPKRMRELMQGEYQRKIVVNKTSMDRFQQLAGDVLVVRSTELVALAAKRGFFQEYGSEALEAYHASLYALRYAGCSISSDELLQYERTLLE